MQSKVCQQCARLPCSEADDNLVVLNQMEMTEEANNCTDGK